MLLYRPRYSTSEAWRGLLSHIPPRVRPGVPLFNAFVINANTVVDSEVMLESYRSLHLFGSSLCIRKKLVTQL